MPARADRQAPAPPAEDAGGPDLMRDPPIDRGQGFLLGRPSIDPAQIAPLAEIPIAQVR